MRKIVSLSFFPRLRPQCTADSATEIKSETKGRQTKEILELETTAADIFPYRSSINILYFDIWNFGRRRHDPERCDQQYQCQIVWLATSPGEPSTQSQDLE